MALSYSGTRHLLLQWGHWGGRADWASPHHLHPLWHLGPTQGGPGWTGPTNASQLLVVFTIKAVAVLSNIEVRWFKLNHSYFPSYFKTSFYNSAIQASFWNKKRKRGPLWQIGNPSMIWGWGLSSEWASSCLVRSMRTSSFVTMRTRDAEGSSNRRLPVRLNWVVHFKFTDIWRINTYLLHLYRVNI